MAGKREQDALDAGKQQRGGDAGPDADAAFSEFHDGLVAGAPGTEGDQAIAQTQVRRTDKEWPL